jgi:segregation and condensation protein B
LLGRRQPPPEPQVRGPLARDERLARVEAVLFLAREPLTSRKIGQLAGLPDGTAARTSVRQLNRLYNAGGSPFRAEELAGGFQLLTRPVFGPWLRRLLHTPVETRLSAPALETLAVVAYRQPVLRADIEAIRGVQCGDILRQLMDRDLVRIVSRADDLGRPLLYGTTRRFLQIFGLRHLDELPQAESLRRGEAPTKSRQESDPPATAETTLPGVPMQTLENRAI